MKVRIICFLFILMVCGTCLTKASPAIAKEKEYIIVIDPGHGDFDPGTISPLTGAKECDCNYAIAIAMRDELRKYKSVKVFLTRPEEGYMTTTGRAVSAAVLNADFLISIHNNSSSDEKANGAVIYASVSPRCRQETGRMGALIAEQLMNAGVSKAKVELRPSTKYENEDYYTVIAEGVRAGVPSIIVEHGFLTNQAEAEFISSEKGAEALGVADAKAVAEYFGLKPNTDDVTAVGATGQHKAIMLSCGITPTFYGGNNPIDRINLDTMWCYLVYDDGTFEPVKPEYVEPIKAGKSGIIDLMVRYKDIYGTLRIINEDEYVQQTYAPLERKAQVMSEQESTQLSTEKESTVEQETVAATDSPTEESIKTATKSSTKWWQFASVTLLLIILGLTAYIVAQKKRQRH